jgi:hypothetical protein
MKHRVVISLALVYDGPKPSKEQVLSDCEAVRRAAERYTAADTAEMRTHSEPQFVSEPAP